jgi:hypothetical protein
MAGKRRMWIADNTVVRPNNAPAVVPTEKKPDVKTTRAIAKAIDKMPDIYELYDMDGRFVGQGSVQKFSLSQELRSNTDPNGIPVNILWRNEFNGYEITGLHAPNSR